MFRTITAAAALALVALVSAPTLADEPTPAPIDGESIPADAPTSPGSALAGSLSTAVTSLSTSAEAAPTSAPAPRASASGSLSLGSTCTIGDLADWSTCTLADGTEMACIGLIMHPLFGPQCTNWSPIAPTP